MHLPVLHSKPALSPHLLSDYTRQAVQALLREGQSENTTASYRAALRYWAGWYGLRYGLPIALPLPAPALLQFIVDHAQRSSPAGLVHDLPVAVDAALVDGGFKGKPGPLALNTLVHRIAVLSKAHQLQGVPNACQDAEVRELLMMTRRAYAKRGAVTHKKDALTRDPLSAALATCDDSLIGKRDRALLMFAWASGGRRRSEVAAADLKFLKRTGPDEFVYSLGHSKTNQSGRQLPDNAKPVAGAAAQALQAWLDAAGITSGALFRRVLRGGHVSAPLSAAAVRTIVQQRCALAGVEGDFSAHSLRSGFVTEAGRQRIPLAETMAMSGHVSVQTVMGYNQGYSQARRHSARLWDAPTQKEEAP